jgi:Peptidase M50B-like
LSKNKKKKDKDKPEVSKAGSLWSVAFFLATIGNFLMFSIAAACLIIIPLRESLSKESLLSFLTGFIFMFLVLVTTKMRKFRTVIHEMKHAILVILTGNKLNKIVANKDDGFVEYQMYEDRLHFAPIISLAPYFFPFFSLPVLISAALVEGQSLVLACLFLGMSLSADICLGIGEIHPSQSDFKSIFGGFWLSKFYLVGFYLFWPTIVYLWVRVGNSGLLLAFEFMVDFFIKVINQT